MSEFVNGIKFHCKYMILLGVWYQIQVWLRLESELIVGVWYQSQVWIRLEFELIVDCETII